MNPGIIKMLAYLLFFGGSLFLVHTLVRMSRSAEMAGKPSTADFDIPEEARFVLFFKPFYALFRPIIERLPVDGYRKRMEKYAVTAGLENDISGNDIIGFQLTTMLIFGILGLQLFESTILIIVAAISGLEFPHFWLYSKKKQRQEQIKLSMPDVVDMLSLSVEAGLAFNAAVQKVCDIYRHDRDPFVVELYLMDQNIKLGRSRDEALKIMAERVDVPELDSFASILIQANKMGSSIADVLKSQADRMRSERFMKAEKVGAQAAQKLLIPMMLLIFPTIFIIILGPYIIQWIMG
jgi:tight adherence protein C